jgi:hypothetical protein
LVKLFGEKLALALGDDVNALLLGMKPARLDDDEKDGVDIPDPIGREQETTIISEPVAAVEQPDPPSAASRQVSPREPATRAHLRVVQMKRGSKFG